MECRRTASPAIVSYLWAARVKRRPCSVTLPPCQLKKIRNQESQELNSELQVLITKEIRKPGRRESQRTFMCRCLLLDSFPLLILFPLSKSEGGVTSHKRFVLGIVKSTGHACCFCYICKSVILLQLVLDITCFLKFCCSCGFTVVVFCRCS